MSCCFKIIKGYIGSFDAIFIISLFVLFFSVSFCLFNSCVLVEFCIFCFSISSFLYVSLSCLCLSFCLCVCLSLNNSLIFTKSPGSFKETKHNITGQHNITFIFLAHQRKESYHDLHQVLAKAPPDIPVFQSKVNKHFLLTQSASWKSFSTII